MTASSPASAWRSVLHPAVVVGALGYFVDIYDLILFSIVRTPSLKSLGLSGQALVDDGLMLLNAQMYGMLLGGVLWGVLGDRHGRLRVLFGSIILYSLANAANGLVHTLGEYAFWRFVAGLGLAGELGGSVTLVSEVLRKEHRGYGTAVVASVGVLGAVAGGVVADGSGWRAAYFVGGGLGLLLLFLRMSVAESELFRRLPPEGARRGHFHALFTDRRRLFKYLCCILIGLPTWYGVGILVTFSPEFAKTLGVAGEVRAPQAVLFAYAGISVGGILSGFASEWIGSRRKVVGLCLAGVAACVALYLSGAARTAPAFYAVIGLMGMFLGYWAIFVTVAAEQFGTNIRATVATTVPNFVRGALPLLVWGFSLARGKWGLVAGAAVVGASAVAIALLALLGLEETHGKDLDYHEPL